MRIGVFLQRKYGITRRDFTQMLREEVLFVNGVQVKIYDTKVQLGDKITIHIPDGLPKEIEVDHLPTLHSKVILFHKPRGYVVSKDDAHNKTIYDILPESWKRDFFYVGRLDKQSSGLLILTNDSQLVDQIENPVYKVHKVYEVEIDKPLRTKDAKKMKFGIQAPVEEVHQKSRDGVQLTHETLSCISCTYKCINGKYFAVITLNEGKNRHIRRIFDILGYKVLALKRVKVGKWTLGSIKPRKWVIQSTKKREKKEKTGQKKKRKNQGSLKKRKKKKK